MVLLFKMDKCSMQSTEKKNKKKEVPMTKVPSSRKVILRPAKPSKTKDSKIHKSKDSVIHEKDDEVYIDLFGATFKFTSGMNIQ